jgi:hypothetical protein
LAAAIAETIPIVSSDEIVESNEGKVDVIESQFPGMGMMGPGMGMMPGMGGMMPGMGGMMPGMGGMMPGMGGMMPGMPAPANNCGCQQICQPWYLTTRF